MDSTDLVIHPAIGFDNLLYMQLQSEAIRERIAHFPNGKLYVEIGGKFTYDPHAQRVLPGFDARVKPSIMNSLGIPYSIIFCVNSQDIKQNRMLSNKDIPYTEYVLAMLQEYQETLKGELVVAITLVDDSTKATAIEFQQMLNEVHHIKTFLRFKIAGYPHAEAILTAQGYGRDEYIPLNTSLVLVCGAASNSGKMGTCLSQLYLDSQHGQDSGYAKYELFPIWNLPLSHPVNRAYEAATVDIGDYNLIDPFHKSAYGIDAVNYNRDVDAFPIVQKIATSIVDHANFMHSYKSPTDMGLNRAGFAIFDDGVVQDAAVKEIKRRVEWFKQQVAEGRGEKKWVEKAEKLVVSF